MPQRRSAITTRRLLVSTAATLASLTGVAATAAPANAQARPAASVPARATGPMSNQLVSTAVAALDALDAGDPAVYDQALARLADAVAWQTGRSATEYVAAWSAAGGERMRVVLAALSQVGVPYRYASASPGVAFDCSGLVKWAWSQAGVALPHQSSSIIRSVTGTSLGDLEPGDVIWYPGHVELALGVGDSFVHAPSRGKTVEVKSGHRRAQRLRFGNPLA